MRRRWTTSVFLPTDVLPFRVLTCTKGKERKGINLHFIIIFLFLLRSPELGDLLGVGRLTESLLDDTVEDDKVNYNSVTVDK